METLEIMQHELKRCNEEGTFLQEIKFINHQYEVELPWRRGAPDILNQEQLKLIFEMPELMRNIIVTED